MRRRLLVGDKKGISEMVSYVLLIMIAVGLSLIVYPYLRDLIWKDKPSCNVDVSLALQDYDCNAANRNITFKVVNKGFFPIDALYVRFDNSSRTVRPELGSSIYFFNISGNRVSLMPGQALIRSYISSKISGPGLYSLEIEPAVFAGSDRELALCERAVIVQDIECK